MRVSDLGAKITLSRRNLLSLLAKLDGYPPNSHCSITRNGVTVKAEEDLEHYGDALSLREAGEMHPDTEQRLLDVV